MRKKNVVIAGGGTGGHIYPGIAIAKAIKAQYPDYEVHFVGTPAGLENKIVPREGFALHHISVGKLNHAGGFLKKLQTLLGIPKSIVQSIALLMELKPQAILGVGGYVSGPFVLVASLMGFKTAIWEPNAFPGMTNRLLSRVVGKSFVVFDEASKHLHSTEITQVGVPIRKEVEDLSQKEFQKRDKDFHILIFGGSQGAHSINMVVKAAIEKGGEWLKDTKIIHQTGPYDYAAILESYKGRNGIEAHEYLYQMEMNYEWADLVICRAGASTVAEIAAAAKPALFIPLPWAADDHQRRNAESLVDHRAAAMLLQKDLTPSSLIQKIEDLKKDTQHLKEMRENLNKFYKSRAAEKMAELLIG